jgi:hypothetical protein
MTSTECPAQHSSLQVVFSSAVLEDVKSLEELERILTRTSADISAKIDGFTLNMPVGFTDYSVVRFLSMSFQRAALKLLFGAEERAFLWYLLITLVTSEAT